MKLKFTLFIFLFFVIQQGNAQLNDNTIAPDFTVTDINGDSYNLYEILEEGKTVILDVFATWCGPCWSYHQTHNLADIYEAYGPDGEDDMFVMAIEADNATNLDCIYGPSNCNGTTFGDWTEGVPYPIVNSSQIGNLYSINYFPTLFIIFPNKLVREMGQLSYDGIVALRDEIPSLSAGINPEVIYYKGKNGATCNPLWPAAPYFLVSNMGEETITSGTIHVYKNGDIVYESQITEEVGPYGTLAEIQISPSLISDNTTFELRIENINGDSDLSYSTFTEINFETNNAIYITAETDANSAADNNRFEIINDQQDVVYSGDLSTANTTIEKVHFLTEGGCYLFRVYDDNGDGINGDVEVRDGEGRLIFKNDEEFSVAESDFNVATVSSVDNAISNRSISITPNPISDLLQISIESNSKNQLDICIVNVFGQLIAHKIVDNQSNISFDATDWSEGVYFVFVQDGNSKISKQVVKN